MADPKPEVDPDPTVIQIRTGEIPEHIRKGIARSLEMGKEAVNNNDEDDDS